MVRLEQKSTKSILMLPIENIMGNMGDTRFNGFQQVLIGSIFSSTPSKESNSQMPRFATPITDRTIGIWGMDVN